MLLLGDVLGVVTGLLGGFLTALSLILSLGLLFPRRARLSREAIEASPVRSLGSGLAWLTLAGGGGLALISVPAPAAKLAGALSLSFLACVAALGASGLALLAGERIRRLDPNASPMSGFARGTMLVVGSGLFPLVGWFFVAPIVVAVGLGASMKAILSRRPAMAEPAS